MLKMKCLLASLGRRVLLACSMFALLMVLSIGMIGMQTASASAEAWSFVRIFHASPDAGIVDVFMDGTKILSNFQYGTVTGYIPTVAGSHKLQIAVIGTGTNAIVLSQTISLQAGIPYTAVALGTRATGLSLPIFADNNQVAGNLAKVRVYHMSPGTGSVDVNSRGNMLISGLPYAQASDYVSIPPGSYTFNVMATQNDTTTPIASQLKPWTVTSIFAISQINNGSSNGKLQFIQAQLTGIPGMPGTGSDPHAQPVSAPLSPSPASLPWTLPILALLGAITGVIIISRRASAKACGRTQ
ncbi:MAG: DUF4397 domain-containing protein [Ktedonobacteraceae bacterium]